jgi:hypothetical protein
MTSAAAVSRATAAAQADRRPGRLPSWRRPSLIAADEPSRGILHRLHPPHLKLPVRRSRGAVHSPVDTAIEIDTGTDLGPLSVGSRQERLLRRHPHLRAPGFAQDLVLDHEHATPADEHLENVEGAAAEGNRLSIDQKFSPIWAAPSGAALRCDCRSPHRIWRCWVDNGCMDAIFAGSVSRLHEDGRLDTAVIHGDGTMTAAKRAAIISGDSPPPRVWHLHPQLCGSPSVTPLPDARSICPRPAVATWIRSRHAYAIGQHTDRLHAAWAFQWPDAVQPVPKPFQPGQHVAAEAWLDGQSAIPVMRPVGALATLAGGPAR